MCSRKLQHKNTNVITTTTVKIITCSPLLGFLFSCFLQLLAPTIVGSFPYLIQTTTKSKKTTQEQQKLLSRSLYMIFRNRRSANNRKLFSEMLVGDKSPTIYTKEEVEDRKTNNNKTCTHLHTTFTWR